MANTSIDDEWSNFITSSSKDAYESDSESEDREDSDLINNFKLDDSIEAPEPSDIYISTKSKIAYLTKPLDYINIFWNIPIIPYSMPKDGVIKKVIKLSSPTPEYLEDIQNRLKKELYYEENVLVSINNPSGRIKFKDVRKISIGISKKDIITYRTKQKKAFSHCFVMILRIKIENEFKEFHVKVFNTGELAIPGVQNDAIFKKVLTTVINILQPYSPDVLTYKQSNDTVLINSNFNCGFFINRDVLYNIIKFKYNLQAMYEPCSYPGIQCKFYYNYDLDIQTGIQPSNSSKNSDNDNNSISNNSNNSNNSNSASSKRIVEMSFMIFRTGSVLIVGMCDEDVIHSIYEFLKSLLLTEFKHIAIGINDANKDKKKKRKIRKRLITINNAEPNNYSGRLSSAEKKAPLLEEVDELF